VSDARSNLMLFPDAQLIAAYEWSQAITDFVRSPQMKGHRIVGLGHSAGAATVCVCKFG